MASRNRLTYPIVLLLLIFICPALLTLLSSFSGTANKAALVGQCAGLAALAVLTLVLVLPARLKSLERMTGQDRLINFHRGIACLLFLILVVHIVSVNIGGLIPLKKTVPPWALPLGQLTALAILGGIIGAALKSSIFPDYNKWRMVHRTLALLVVTATLHGLFIGSHLAMGPLFVVFLALLVLALLLTAYRRFYVPQNLPQYEVIKVQAAADKVLSLTLAPKGEGIEELEAGQYAYVTLAPEQGSPEEHPFTISSHSEQTLTLTVKQSGDFTNKITSIKEGSVASIEGPYGTFGHNLEEAESFIFIAGGVGITPLYSLYMYLKEQNDERKGLFITAARHRSDFIFGKDLKEPFGNWQIVPLLSAPDEEWQGARGHVDKALLSEHARELLPNAQVYLCGPDAMMTSVEAALRELSVPAGRIYYERFTFP